MVKYIPQCPSEEKVECRCVMWQVYFEAKVTDEGLSRVGWATRSAALELGTDKGGFGYGGTGMASHNGSFTEYGQKFGMLSSSQTFGPLCHVSSTSISVRRREDGVPQWLHY